MARYLFARALPLMALALMAAGCATAASPLGATMETRQALRAEGIAPMALGTFTAAPAIAGGDRRIQIRGDALVPPDGGTFSGFLRTTLETELSAAGRLDPASGTVVSGEIVESMVDSMASTPNAALAARFTVTRAGSVAFDKVIRVTDRWDYEFIGALAIPEAQERYVGLYTTLVRALVSDPEFRAAVSAR